MATTSSDLTIGNTPNKKRKISTLPTDSQEEEVKGGGGSRTGNGNADELGDAANFRGRGQRSTERQATSRGRVQRSRGRRATGRNFRARGQGSTERQATSTSTEYIANQVIQQAGMPDERQRCLVIFKFPNGLPAFLKQGGSLDGHQDTTRHHNASNEVDASNLHHAPQAQLQAQVQPGLQMHVPQPKIGRTDDLSYYNMGRAQTFLLDEGVTRSRRPPSRLEARQ